MTTTRIASSADARALFIDELTKVSRKLRTLFDARVRRIGLTLSRARCLRHLMQADRMTQTELADALEIENPTLVRLLDGLEKQNLIERCPVDGDRRAKHIALTAFGRAQAEEITRIAGEVRVEILRDLSEADLLASIEVFRHIGETIEACRADIPS
ncbi:MarR family winged helix-turn-helix transcriptional regulator [Microvirga antarctica]|uniref:MarR family winged helix-turn-helix transcriptional regulator n=1 Tax=Microvirga antarctica TaxID=2819233 RepID=UPI001B30C209|nr:MarR family transcriptional regulator [Microvirga antarctica]